jgi:hypothetical protein
MEFMYLLFLFVVQRLIEFFQVSLLAIVDPNLDLMLLIMVSFPLIISEFQLIICWIGYQALTKKESSSVLSKDKKNVLE